MSGMITASVRPDPQRTISDDKPSFSIVLRSSSANFYGETRGSGILLASGSVPPGEIRVRKPQACVRDKAF